MPKSHLYMTVGVQELERQFSVNCWFSVMDTWLLELDVYTNSYTEETDIAIWHIQCDHELTVKQLLFICDYADEIMSQTIKRNRDRIAANLRRRLS